MPTVHRVRAGECMTSIAEKAGLYWETIWQDPANDSLRALREDPNVLQPGDLVTIPDVRPKKIQRGAGARHSFTRRGIPARVEVVLRDSDGSAISDEPYVLTIGQSRHEGTTDGSGRVEGFLPAGATQGVIELPGLGVSWPILLGQLDPIESNEGVQQRLANLGYPCGRADGEIGPSTESAIAAFRAAQDMDEGTLDDAFRDRLKEVHGS